MSLEIHQGEEAIRRFLEKLRARQSDADQTSMLLVQEILDDVRQEGDAAVRRYNTRFDGQRGPVQVFDRAAMQAAKERLAPDLVTALERALAKIRRFHEAEIAQGFILTEPTGAVMGQRVLALEKVGIYVPGGTAAYPSSVLMNAIPARIAGVEEMVMVTPPGPDGRPSDVILAAAAVADVDVCYAVGGAQAIAALAYGTESIPAVDKIVGPGNQYVAWAKRLVFGQVDIDMIAGPSEILILADSQARPAFLAADLLSQAEHDPQAGAVLISDNADLAQAVQEEVKRRLADLPRQDTAAKALADFGAILVCDNMDQAIAYANRLAPEHLEIQCAEPWEILTRIQHAGSVFLGPWTPEAVGDYYAGPNHVLPTGGSARFSSPLGVADFTKRMAYTAYSQAALEEAAADIMTIAKAEGLEAHSRSVEVRIQHD